MNNVTNSIPLHRIVIPELTSAEFASGLQNAFININKNFALLANADFVKGESGESVKIQDNSFFNEDGSINTLGLKLKACIKNGVSDELIDVHYTDENGGAHTISVWDNFTPANAGTIQMIYSQVNDNALPTPLSSLYYVFLDARYANNVIGAITRDDEHASQYANLKDMSCILVYDKDVSVTIEQDGNTYTVTGGFKMLTNAFPTVYYESGVGLCWKINGANTGIPVQGLPGRDGKNATTSIVKCSNVEKSEYNIIFGEVTHIHNNFNGYQLIDSTTDITKYNNNAALVLVTEDSTNTNSTNTEFDCGFYFGQLKIENGKLYAYCDQQNAINHGLSTQAVINAMKSIDINNNGVNTSEGMKGLYIPIRQVDNAGAQPIHIISATNFSDSTGDLTARDKSDIIFTAIDDINSFDSNATLLVDKYLYVRLNPVNNIFFIKDDNNDSELNKLSGYNYVLKYKLSNVVNRADSLYLGVYNTENTAGGRYIGGSVKIDDDTTVDLSLNQDKIRYYKYGTPNATDTDVVYSENHLDSMPGIFKDRLIINRGDINKPGIYRWVLCDDFHDFDVTDLKNAPADTKNGNKYIFPAELKTIFTDTITPGEDTKFLWFNGILLAGKGDLGITAEDKYNVDGIITSTGDGTPNSASKYYVVPGWCPMDNEWNSLFSFVKFIPVYENSMKYIGDTALNLNYNVNIGGTTDEYEKSITVNGKVNCNDLNVYNLTAAGEIKHIYTKDTIVGDDGIKLGVIVDDGNIQGYNTTIDNSGNISINGDIHTPALNTNKDNISVENNITAKKSITNGLEINSLSGNNHIYIGNIGDETDAKLGIEVKDINVSISRTNLRSTESNLDVDDVPKIINNTPVINYDKTNVIITNNDPSSDLLQYYGNMLGVNKGTGTISDISPNNTTGSFNEVFDANILAIDYKINSKNAFKKDTKTVDYEIAEATLEDMCDKISQKYGANKSDIVAGNVNAINAMAHHQITSSISYNSQDSVNKNTICNFTISRPATNNGETIKLNSNDNIVMQFNSKYLVRVCCIGKCSNGKRPIIDSKSKLTLKVLYKQSGAATFTEIPALAKTYTFNGTTRWYGYDINGGYISSYEYHHRYYDFVFKPNNITISNGTTAFANICSIFNNGGEVDIRIIAYYDIQFISEKSGKEVIRGGFVYLPVPIKNEITLNGVANNTKVVANKLVLSINEFNNYKNTEGSKFNNNPAKLSYSTLTGSATDYTNTTTLCNDGIVVCSANNQTTHIFGLGMKEHKYNYNTDDGNAVSNEYRPVLRYYRKSSENEAFNQDKFVDLTSLFDHLSEVLHFNDNDSANDLIYNSGELVTTTPEAAPTAAPTLPPMPDVPITPRPDVPDLDPDLEPLEPMPDART